MLAAKHWIPSSHLAASPGLQAMDPLALPFDDITPVVMRLQSFTFVLISLYLTSGPKLLGRNASKLAQVATWVLEYNLPWLIPGRLECGARHPQE